MDTLVMESKEVVIATTASTKVRIVFFILFILFSVAKLSFFLQLLSFIRNNPYFCSRN